MRPCTKRSRRLWAATEARALGYGGIALVARATGLSPATIGRGLTERDADVPLPVARVRKPGAGRKRATTHQPTPLRDLEALVEPTVSGDPESPLRWTCLSTRTLAMALEALGHAVSHTVVAELLHGLGYSLQSNVKTREGRQHSDRDAQFRSIARQVRAAQRRQQPTISVDTKKKELVGPFKNGGRAWRPTKTPQRVRAHDFVIPGAGGKAIPYGVYDPHRNEGWVSVGIDHDMATFAVRSIRRWWQHMRRRVYRDAVTLLITADAGPTASTARRSRSARSFCSTSAVQPDECPRHVDQGAREAAAYHSRRRKRRITMADCRSAGRENARGGVPRMT